MTFAHDLIAYIQHLGPLAPLGIILGLVIQQLVPVFPSAVLLALAGALFGPVWGILISWTGVLTSSVVCYALGRKGGVWARRWIKSDIQTTVEGYLEGRSVLTIFMLRAIPLFPFNAVSILSGMFRLRFRGYIVATGLGILPNLSLYVLLGESLSKNPFTPLTLGYALGLCVLAAVGFKVLKR